MSALIVFMVLGLSQQRDVPDDLNAMVEYRRAADLLSQEPLQAVYQSISRSFESFDLNARRALLPRIVRVYEAVQSGNARRYAVSRVVLDDETEGLHYLAEFKMVAKALGNYAEVLMADGKTNEAFDVLVATYVMGGKIGLSADLIHDLLGYAVQSIATGQIASQLQRLSLPGAERILAAVALPEQDNELLKAVIIRDFQSTMNRVENLSSDQAYRSIAAIIDLPEARWWPEISKLSSAASAEDPSVADDPFVTMEQFFRAKLQNRAVTRLLRLHSYIVRFRWLHGRLPLTLAELGQPGAVIDPLTGFEFEYELRGETYDLYSRGFGLSGPIRLKYAATGGSPVDPIDPSAQEEN